MISDGYYGPNSQADVFYRLPADKLVFMHKFQDVTHGSMDKLFRPKYGIPFGDGYHWWVDVRKLAQLAEHDIVVEAGKGAIMKLLQIEGIFNRRTLYCMPTLNMITAVGRLLTEGLQSSVQESLDVKVDSPQLENLRTSQAR